MLTSQLFQMSWQIIYYFKNLHIWNVSISGPPKCLLTTLRKWYQVFRCFHGLRSGIKIFLPWKHKLDEICIHIVYDSRVLQSYCSSYRTKDWLIAGRNGEPTASLFIRDNILAYTFVVKVYSIRSVRAKIQGVWHYQQILFASSESPFSSAEAPRREIDRKEARFFESEERRVREEAKLPSKRLLLITRADVPRNERQWVAAENKCNRISHARPMELLVAGQLYWQTIDRRIVRRIDWRARQSVNRIDKAPSHSWR